MLEQVQWGLGSRCTRIALQLAVVCVAFWLIMPAVWFLFRDSTGLGESVAEVVIASAYLLAPLGSVAGAALAIIGLLRTTGPKAKPLAVLALNLGLLGVA